MNIEVAITIVLGVVFAFSIGASDETLATLIGSGGIRLRYALIIGASLAGAGAYFLSHGVAESIGSDIINGSAVDLARFQAWILISILISVTAWLLVSSRTGVPVSTTYSIVGAFIGVAFCAPLLNTAFPEAIRWDQLGDVFVGLVASPVLGLAIAYAVAIGIKRFVRRRIGSLSGLENFERVLLIVLVFFSFFNQLNRAGNDAGKALGIFYGLAAGGQIDSLGLALLLVTGSAAVGLGLLLFGRNLLKNVGKNLIEIRPSDAICIETSMSVVLVLANLLGLPISGGQVLVFSILGLSLSKHEPINNRKLKRMVYSWIVTLPVAALSTAGILALLLLGLGA
ncbi:MAG: inorganic phosphate transporter [Candidatus Lokiarchaeota archaeon]|nr:inorganic phosphate transporter [Candidatus Lokiarchaeota archaeon]